jgi:hypothetical protein
MAFRSIQLSVVFIVVSALALKTTAARARESFVLWEDRPEVGTRLLKKSAESALPYDTPYAELSPQQKELVRRAYENLPDDHEPPYPLNGMGSIARQLIQVQQKLAVPGRLVAAAQVDANGDVQNLQIYSTPGEDLSRLVALVLMSEKFKPAICAGVPCAMDFPIRMQFQLR